jgi:hypothetical protein
MPKIHNYFSNSPPSTYVALVSLTFSHSLVVTAPTNDQYLSTKQREEKKPIISSTLINIHLSQSSDLFIPYLQNNIFSQNQSNHY